MPGREREPDRNDTDKFADLEQFSQEPGFIYSFCLMVARCLWMSTDDVAEIDWTDRPNQEELSLLLGLLVKHPIRLEAIPSEETILKLAIGCWYVILHTWQIEQISSLSPQSSRPPGDGCARSRSPSGLACPSPRRIAGKTALRRRRGWRALPSPRLLLKNSATVQGKDYDATTC